MPRTRTAGAQDAATDAGKTPKPQILIRLSPEAAAALERLAERLAASRQVAKVTATETARGAIEAILRLADADPDLAIKLIDGAHVDEASISAHAPKGAVTAPRLAAEPGIDAVRELLVENIAISASLRDQLRDALARPSSALVHAELATIRLGHERRMADILDHARYLISRVRATSVSVHDAEADPDDEDLVEDDDEAAP
jgi:hypothetical protein